MRDGAECVKMAMFTERFMSELMCLVRNSKRLTAVAFSGIASNVSEIYGWAVLGPKYATIKNFHCLHQVKS